MTRTLKAAAVAVGVVGAIVVGLAMLSGPLLDEPAPGAVERLVIFAYPLCLLLAGVFVVLRTRIALLYAVLAIVFAAAFVAFHLSGDHAWNGIAEQVINTIIVVGPAMIVTSLCWSVLRLESGPAIPTRLG